MIVVTGAAGFIGSCIVAELNRRGYKDLILVDHFGNEEKRANIENKAYTTYYDKKDFLALIEKDALEIPVEALIHMGACSSTIVQDAQYFQENNYDYTLKLAQWALAHEVRFIYASSAATYGDGHQGYKDDDVTIRQCQPLNLYGESKQKFDLKALDNGWLDRMVGLKFFNVFGPNEYHKGDMRSVIAKAYHDVADKGLIRLFKSYKPDYQDGEQKRDFIYVKDVVDVVLFFMDHKECNGIYNVGTGQARTWVDLAKAMFDAVGKEPHISFIEIPDILKERYQYFTQAHMDKLKLAGYSKPFTSLEMAVKDYVSYLKDRCYL